MSSPDFLLATSLKLKKSHGKQHLHRYLSEFDFRYNARETSDGERAELAIKGVNGKRLMLRDSKPVM